MLVTTPRSGTSSFFGTYTNKIDAKGRVQAPAEIRRVLDLTDFNGFFCYPNLDEARLDCGGPDFVDGLKASICALDPHSQDREDLEIAVLAEICPIQFDQHGRFVLPQRLREHLGAEDLLRFVGRGDAFQIWPAAGADEAARAHRERARLAIRRLTHPGQPPRDPSPGPGPGPGSGSGSGAPIPFTGRPPRGDGA